MLYSASHDAMAAAADTWAWSLGTRSQSGVNGVHETGQIYGETLGSAVFLTSGAGGSRGMRRVDYTDGAGHGILVAVDQMFAQVTGVSMPSAVVIHGVLAYRFKEVTLTEYVGMVTEQQ